MRLSRIRSVANDDGLAMWTSLVHWNSAKRAGNGSVVSIHAPLARTRPMDVVSIQRLRRCGRADGPDEHAVHQFGNLLAKFAKCDEPDRPS